MSIKMEEDHREYDRRCKKWFNDNTEYHNHKIFSPNHITCIICSQDFISESARARHQTQLHNASQDLQCTNCSEKFTRLGALMAHVTKSACLYNDVRRAFVDKEKIKKTAEELEKLTLGARHVEEPPPMPSVKLSVKSPDLKVEDVDWMDENQELEFQDPPPPPAILWGNDELDEPVTKDMNKDFPKLGKAEYRDGFSKVEDLLTGGADPLGAKEDNKWAGPEKKGKGKALFPDAPPNPLKKTIASAIVQEANVQKNKENAENPLHPDSPKFRLRCNEKTCWNPITGRWNCPYPDCKRQYEKEGSWLAHLCSETHVSVKLRCPRCHNLYAGPVALTQHVESQATSCYMRDSSNANKAVHTITGGIASVAGRHDDGTVKYAVYETFTRPGPGAVQEIEIKYRVGGTAEKEAAEMREKAKKNTENIKW